MDFSIQGLPVPIPTAPTNIHTYTNCEDHNALKICYYQYQMSVWFIYKLFNDILSTEGVKCCQKREKLKEVVNVMAFVRNCRYISAFDESYRHSWQMGWC
jgi:hypothetical protein